MPLLWKPHTSDVTQFLDELKSKRPSLEAEQQAGRALLWDKRIDRTAQSDFQGAKVPQPAYVYFSPPKR